MNYVDKCSLLMKRAVEADLSQELQQNLATLEQRVNALLADIAYAGPVRVTSGYRPVALNATIANAGANSWHTKCAAVDLADADGKLWAALIANVEVCKKHKIWLEDKRWTPTWVHLQIYPPKSGKRIFVPSSAPAKAPKAWSGQYDKKHD